MFFKNSLQIFKLNHSIKLINFKNNLFKNLFSDLLRNIDFIKLSELCGPLRRSSQLKSIMTQENYQPIKKTNHYFMISKTTSLCSRSHIPLFCYKSKDSQTHIKSIMTKRNYSSIKITEESDKKFPKNFDKKKGILIKIFIEFDKETVHVDTTSIIPSSTSSSSTSSSTPSKLSPQKPLKIDNFAKINTFTGPPSAVTNSKDLKQISEFKSFKSLHRGTITKHYEVIPLVVLVLLVLIFVPSYFIFYWLPTREPLRWWMEIHQDTESLIRPAKRKFITIHKTKPLPDVYYALKKIESMEFDSNEASKKLPQANSTLKQTQGDEESNTN